MLRILKLHCLLSFDMTFAPICVLFIAFHFPYFFPPPLPPCPSLPHSLPFLSLPLPPPVTSIKAFHYIFFGGGFRVNRVSSEFRDFVISLVFFSLPFVLGSLTYSRSLFYRLLRMKNVFGQVDTQHPSLITARTHVSGGDREAGHKTHG